MKIAILNMQTYKHHFHSVPPCEHPVKNGGCDQKCSNNGKEAICSCDDGYKLVLPEKKKCELSKYPCSLKSGKDTKYFLIHHIG